MIKFVALALLLLAGCGPANPAPPGPDSALFLPRAKMPPLSAIPAGVADVCPLGRCRFATIAEAYAAAQPGETITIGPGNYDECVVIKDKPIAIVGRASTLGALPRFTKACQGKAAIIVAAPQFLLANVQIAGIKVADRNGACLRFDPRKNDLQLALINVICRDSENGLLGGLGDSGSLIIRESQFIANGANAGRSHGFYIPSGGEVVLERTTVARTKGQGHSVKVGAKRLIIDGSTIAALSGRNSRAIDFFGGGVLAIRNSVLQQAQPSDNHEFIALAMEPRRRNEGAQHATLVADSWFIYDDLERCCRWLLNGEKLGPVILDTLTLVGLTDLHMETDTARNINRFATRAAAGLPAYDGTLASLPRPALN